jgi:predicted alpha/beta superfamily hydrolase
MNSRLLVTLFIALLWANPLAAEAVTAESKPIVLGQTITIESIVMGEARTINVWLPSSYAKSKQTYPVLYVIDGGLEQDFLHVTGTAQLGMIWGRNVEAIIVGIETNDRRKELVGATEDAELLRKYPTAGKSAQFRRFIREEVQPLVTRQFRTDENNAVIGESLAGLFIVETWLDEPDLFDGYAAISPSLWWDGEALSRKVAASPTERMGKQPRLYLNIANEGAEMQAGVDRVVGALGPVADWCYAPRADLTHATIYQQSEAAAIQFLLPSPYAGETEGFEIKCASRSAKAGNGG